jgi:hypothetical protein
MAYICDSFYSLEGQLKNEKGVTLLSDFGVSTRPRNIFSASFGFLGFLEAAIPFNRDLSFP